MPKFFTDSDAKRDKILNTPLVIEGLRPASTTKRGELANAMSAGVHINKNNATFLTKKEEKDGHFKEKDFLLKPQEDGIAAVFGVHMLRASSVGVIAKRTLLTRIGNKFVQAIKWDKNAVGNFALEFHEDWQGRAHGLFSDSVNVVRDENFVTSCARSAGAFSAIGKEDHNPENFLRSSKTGLLVNIDNDLIVNRLTSGFERVKGSSLTNDFLRIFLAGDIVKPSYLRRAEAIHHLEKKAQLSDRKFNETTNETYNEGIDASLLARIKENINKKGNEHLKKYFKEFMFGLTQTLALAQNNEFLDQYTLKYKTELGPDQYEQARKLRAAFVANAMDARNLYQQAGFFAYYKELQQEELAQKNKLKIPKSPENKGAAKIGQELKAASELLDIRRSIEDLSKNYQALERTQDKIKIYIKNIEDAFAKSKKEGERSKMLFERGSETLEKKKKELGVLKKEFDKIKTDPQKMTEARLRKNILIQREKEIYAIDAIITSHKKDVNQNKELQEKLLSESESLNYESAELEDRKTEIEKKLPALEEKEQELMLQAREKGRPAATTPTSPSANSPTAISPPPKRQNVATSPQSTKPDERLRRKLPTPPIKSKTTSELNVSLKMTALYFGYDKTNEIEAKNLLNSAIGKMSTETAMTNREEKILACFINNLDTKSDILIPRSPDQKLPEDSRHKLGQKFAKMKNDITNWIAQDKNLSPNANTKPQRGTRLGQTNHHLDISCV